MFLWKHYRLFNWVFYWLGITVSVASYLLTYHKGWDDVRTLWVTILILLAFLPLARRVSDLHYLMFCVGMFTGTTLCFMIYYIE